MFVFPTPSRMRIWRHTDDWCHFCGQVRSDLADVNGPAVSRHAPDTGYLRVCAECGDRIARVARGLDPDDPSDWPER